MVIVVGGGVGVLGVVALGGGLLAVALAAGVVGLLHPSSVLSVLDHDADSAEDRDDYEGGEHAAIR